MLLDLKPLFQGEKDELAFVREVDFSDVELWGGHPFCDPVKVTGKAFCRAGIVLLQYNAQFTLHVECCRCLEEFTPEYSMDFSATVVRELSGEDSGEFLVARGDQLDLADAVRADVLLSLPIKWVCREECRGLCPKCGANLNQGDCGCTFREEDPRLAALRKLLEERFCNKNISG